MDYLSDPAVITPILVVTFHIVTAAGFWFYRRRRRTRLTEPGKLRLLSRPRSAITSSFSSMGFLLRLRPFCGVYMG